MPYKFNGKEFDEETGLYYLWCTLHAADGKHLVWGGSAY